MRRRGFFTKLLGGTIGAVAGVTATREARAEPQPEPKAQGGLVWAEDKYICPGASGVSYFTSRPVAANSLVVQLNGLTLVRGDGCDYITVPRSDETGEFRVTVKMNDGVERRNDLLVLRYQTWEATT